MFGIYLGFGIAGIGGLILIGCFVYLIVIYSRVSRYPLWTGHYKALNKMMGWAFVGLILGVVGLAIFYFSWLL